MQPLTTGSGFLMTTVPGGTPIAASAMTQAVSSGRSIRSSSSVLATADVEVREKVRRQARKQRRRPRRAAHRRRRGQRCRRRAAGRTGWCGSRPSLHPQVQEVRRARDARVVAPDELFEAVCRLVVREVAGRDGANASGRPRWRPGSGSSAGRSGRSRRGPPRRARSDGRAGRAAPRSPRPRRRDPVSRARRRSRRPIVVDDVERLGGRVDQLHGPGDDAPERVAPDLVREPGRGQRLGRARMEPVAGEGDPRGRSEEVDLAGMGPRLERVRPADLVLLERVLPVGRGEVEAVGRDDPALVHRVVGRMAERDEPRLALECGRLEGLDDRDGLEGDVQRRGQLGRRAVISDRVGT